MTHINFQNGFGYSLKRSNFFFLSILEHILVYLLKYMHIFSVNLKMFLFWSLVQILFYHQLITLTSIW